MSDENGTRRPRSPINPVKILNKIRDERGLPRVSPRAKTVRITQEIKKAVVHQEIERLYPEALTESHYAFTDDQAARLGKDVEFRLKRIKAGKEASPV